MPCTAANNTSMQFECRPRTECTALLHTLQRHGAARPPQRASTAGWVELLQTRACQPSVAALRVHMHIVRFTDTADQALHTRIRQLWRATLSPEAYMSIR